jgi:nucleoid DNA-binding protein
MQELINRLTDQAGLSEEQATRSIQVITEYIQEQLPPMMKGMVADFLNKRKNEEDEDGIE